METSFYFFMSHVGETTRADMASQKRERFGISSSFQVEGSYLAGNL